MASSVERRESESGSRVSVRFSFGLHNVDNLGSIPGLKENIRDFFSNNDINIYVFETPNTLKSRAEAFNRNFSRSKSVKDASLHTSLFPRLGRPPTEQEKDIWFKNLLDNPEQAFYTRHYLMLDELLADGLDFDVRLETAPEEAGVRLDKKWNSINGDAARSRRIAGKGDFNEAIKQYRKFLNACSPIQREREMHILDQIAQLAQEGLGISDRVKIFYRIGVAHQELFDQLLARDLPDSDIEKSYDIYPPYNTLEAQALRRLVNGEQLSNEDIAHAFIGLLTLQIQDGFVGDPSAIQARRKRINTSILQLSMEEMKALVRKIPRLGLEEALKPLFT